MTKNVERESYSSTTLERSAVRAPVLPRVDKPIYRCECGGDCAWTVADVRGIVASHDGYVTHPEVCRVVAHLLGGGRLRLLP